MDPESSPLPRRRVSLVRYQDDRGLILRGRLIPPQLKKTALPAVATTPPPPALAPMRSLLVILNVLVAMLVLGGAGVLLGGGAFSKMPLAAALGAADTPEIMFESPYSGVAIPPRYGPAPAMEDEAFYGKARDRLIEGGASFIDLDLVRRQLRYFEKGVLTLTLDVEKKPVADSWCAVAAGIYQVDAVRPTHTSTFLDAVLPDSIIFGANLFIHSWPQATDGGAVPDDFDRDCVRLKPDAAAALAEAVAPGDTVLVYEKETPRTEAFTYESKVPRFSTPYYLIADLKSDTVIAVGDKHGSVPIASLTKLMTALVAIEAYSLDDELAVNEPNLIETLVPRLRERSQISVYALLQLLLVESSNEAAEVLASGMGREQFVARMNERARELGLVDTTFTDPSGVDAGNVSSVNDLWWLTRYLYLHRPFIFELTAQTDVLPPYVHDSYSGLMNFNRVETVQNFFGGKIGETEAARQTSITLHHVPINDSVRDVAVILLRSEGRKDDVLRLLSYLEERFSE